MLQLPAQLLHALSLHLDHKHQRLLLRLPECTWAAVGLHWEWLETGSAFSSWVLRAAAKPRPLVADLQVPLEVPLEGRLLHLLLQLVIVLQLHHQLLHLPLESNTDITLLGGLPSLGFSLVSRGLPVS